MWSKNCDLFATEGAARCAECAHLLGEDARGKMELHKNTPLSKTSKHQVKKNNKCFEYLRKISH
jgi:hypothetical protein